MQSQRPSATPDAAADHTTIDSSTLYPTAIAAARTPPGPASIFTAAVAPAIPPTSVAPRCCDTTQEQRCAACPLLQPTRLSCLTIGSFFSVLAGWLDLFTDEVLVIRDTITRIEYDPASPMREGDWAIYVRAPAHFPLATLLVLPCNLV
jgi:hypothetical protein